MPRIVLDAFRWTVSFSQAWYEVQTNLSLGGVPRVTQLIEPFIQEVFKNVLCAGAFLYARADSNKPGGGH